MEKIYDILKRYKIAVISALIIILLGITGMCLYNAFNKGSPITVNKKNYTLTYDKSWKLKKAKEENIILTHSSGSKVSIQINNLNDEFKYLTVDELIDEILYNIEKQNNSYKLLSKKTNKITKNRYDGYKMLYENDDKQVMVSLFKKSDKLVIISYEANIKYFDILLDNVNEIIYNFDTTEEKFDLSSKIKIKTSAVKFSKNESLSKKIKDTKDYEIAQNNYYVNYKIPSIFKLTSISSALGLFSYSDSSSNLDISVSIMASNLYTYLDKNEASSIFSQNSIYKKDKSYSDFEEAIEKYDSDYDSYIYKNSYYYKLAPINKQSESKQLNEKVVLVYALNNSHTLKIEVSSRNGAIPEELIKNIKINSSKNYSSYITSKKQDGYLTSELKRFSDYTKEKIDNITIKLPEKYKEIDKNQDIYEDRYYGLNYSEETELYEYEVHYQLSTLNDPDKIVDIANNTFSKAYGDYNYYKYTGEITANDKQFKIYEGGYTGISGVMFTNKNRNKYYINKKLLFYKLSNGYIVVELTGNGSKISDDFLKEATNFTIETKNI